MTSATTCPVPGSGSRALAPFRGEAFSAEHLETHFSELGKRLQVVVKVSPNSKDFSSRFEDNAAQIAAAHQTIIDATRASEVVPAEAEWLLDNYYVVEEQLREIRDDLPRGFYHELPKLEWGHPRVYELARELVIHTDSSLDEEMVRRCLEQFQQSAPLTIGEVWAVPIMLRLVLIENLRRLCDQMVLTYRCRASARRMLDGWQPEQGFALDAHTEPHCIPTVIQLLEQLPERGPGHRPAIKLLEKQVSDWGWNLGDIIRQEHQRQAANSVSIGNVITSMRLIASLEWDTFFEQVNYAERVLRRDPAGVYSQMHFESRDQYRHVVEELAKRTEQSDVHVAELAVARAQEHANDATLRRSHVGYWLVDAGRADFERQLGYRPPLKKMIRHAMLQWPDLTYFGLLGIFTLLGAVAIVLTCAWLAVPVGVTILLSLCWLLPASELAQSLVNLIITNVLRPRLLPRFDFKAGVPAKYPTIVVVPSMLSSPGEVDSLLARLESHFLANSDEALLFALLTDFSDAEQAETSKDAPLVERAMAGIRRLNQRYQVNERQPFYLFHRRRQWNAAEATWMGWERKRGKLMEFGKLLQGHADTSYVVQEGDLAALERFRGKEYTPFVITLDSDTQLPHETARKLIGTLAHPLNRPQFSADHSRVTAGYTILQPRVNVHLASAGKSWFAKIFAGSPGVDPYSTAASDVYQDLFGEGSFTGKGIYDLHAFERALGSAFPENTILSHDLIEGCHARVGLVTNIEVYDGYPTRYDAEARRAHRWVRGDWQLLPWLLPYVPYESGWKPNPLSLLSRWKVVDNLRRSLVPPLLLMGLVAGWFLVPRGAWAWTLAAFFVLLFPLFAQVALIARNWSWKMSFAEQSRAVSWDLLKTLMQCGLMAAVLPHKAWSMLDAISRTLLRMFVTRRSLLEWETAAAVEWRVSQSRWSLLLQMAIWPVAAVIIGCLLPRASLLAASPFLFLWIAAPLIVHWLSQPIVVERSKCNELQQSWLREIASETWAFFEAYVGLHDHWLPVDNVQEEPHEKIAHRLSPTNEGLYLLSALIARDFGYLGAHGLATLAENNFQSLGKLEKLHGHFYNWYDTETLQPLLPRYVSTVDSGNLAACLLTLHAGLHEVIRGPLLRGANHRGLLDTLDLLEEACELAEGSESRAAQKIARPVATATQRLASSIPSVPADLWDWHQQTLLVKQFLAELPSPAIDPAEDPALLQLARKFGVIRGRLTSFCEDADQLFGWVPLAAELTGNRGSQVAPASGSADRGALWSLLNEQRSLAQLVAIETTAKDLLNQPTERSSQLAAALASSARAAQALHQRLEQLATAAEHLAVSMDFRFLFNPQRRLFSIGYNVEEGRLDRSHYDMLCSEARLASYLAIAKGDVEATHWFRLGRHATIAAGKFALLSWGGTMFEYLMPQLFQRQYEGSLLTQSCQAAVLRQQEFGRQHGIPWGISESAFGALAINSDYHYRSFGVPGLGLKRGLAKDLVVSPYSTLMALTVDPAAAVDNLHALADEGGLGYWGFYDALDYTPERVPFGKRRIVVRCYMAHHQGMGMLALANTLQEGSIQRRFNAHPLARATELLLQERVPTVMTPFEPHADEVEPVDAPQEEQQLVSRRLVGIQHATPRTHLLSNGTYSLMLTSAGGGYSRCANIDISRWRPDPTLDAWGQFIYLRELDSEQVWSPTYQPTCVSPDSYEAIFAIDKVEFHRRQGELETLLEVAVSPENNAEVRQLRITNHGSEEKRIQVTSYAEIALAPPAADLSHPAFQKLFVETEYIPEEATLLARRRPRDAQQKPTYAVHVLATPHHHASDIQYETSRQAFLGRRHSAADPHAVQQAKLSAETGAVLDPVFSLRCTVAVPAGESVTVAYSTAYADSREAALSLADQYHEPRNVQRVFELAWAYAQVELRHQHLSPGQVHLYQRLASFLLYPHRSLRGDEAVVQQNRLGQSGLWRHGISGDVPILLARVTEPEHIGFVRELTLAQRFWRERGFRADLVIINDYPGSYLDALQDQITALMQEVNSAAEKPGVYVLRGAHLPPEEHALFEAAAACVLHGERGSLPQQLDAANQLANKLTTHATPRSRLARVAKESAKVAAIAASSPEPLELWNGYGGFAQEGREYRIRVQQDQLPPMPWSQVVANPQFGFLVTESGGGYSWFANSRENKLTTWANDPVADSPSEILYLRDEATGETWLPVSGDAAVGSATDARPHETWSHYGAGYARFVNYHPTLATEVFLGIDQDQPVKFIRLKITNRSSQPKTFTASYFAEMVLGVCREQTNLHVQSSFDTEHQALLLRNPYHPEYPHQVSFLKTLSAVHGYTADRTEFLGRHGNWQRPQAIQSGKVQPRTGVGYDPCALMQSRVTVAPQQSQEVIFLFGADENEAAVRALLEKFESPADVDRAIQRNLGQWDETLNAIQVKTPNRQLDLMVNRWLPYQVLACRMWGRSALYQSGGAFGFRDQLQDTMALVYSRPKLVREHLLRAASRQYRQGDVQHWWHPPLGKGTRTKFSDDLLWLPYAVSHYVRVTGDEGVLNDTASFLESPPLQAHEHERYEQPKVSGETATLYEHCLRAIDRGLQFGAHGLPLMGCGDWNDGMNKVGEEGRGESVWVGWFLLVLIDDFLPLMHDRNDAANIARLETVAKQLRTALEEQAWDGDWYRRAYFDDGQPLGSAQNDECQIDSLAQTWAVFANADRDRARKGVQAAVDQLVDRDGKLVLLFTPPFDKGELDPGYIKGYLPGIRENGGQYTHAATWLIQALAQLGDREQAMSIFNLINPLNHTQTLTDVARYQTEPYVIAADVYGMPPHVGRGGWTWYTGSAAWFYRVAVEQLLGLKVTPESASLEPCVPDSWEGFSVTIRRGGSNVKLTATRGQLPPSFVSHAKSLGGLDGKLQPAPASAYQVTVQSSEA